LKWEVPLLISFIIILGISVSQPNDNIFYTVDSSGNRIYVLVPEVSNFDLSVDNVTNFLLIRYDDPWAIYVTTAILIAGIFASLTKPVRDYLKIKFRILQNTPAPHHLTNQNQFTILVKDKILSYHNSSLSEKLKVKISDKDFSYYFFDFYLFYFCSFAFRSTLLCICA